MASFFQRKPVKICRTIFRWCRIVFLLLVFAAVVCLTYLHIVGLPDFLKRPLLQTLREHGLEAKFSSARLGWGASIVVENPYFQTTNAATSPRLSAGMAELALDWKALLHRRAKVDSFQISEARLQLPTTGANAPLTVNDVSLRLVLVSSNIARLENALFTFRGVQLRLNGAVTNYSELRWWRSPFPIKSRHPKPRPSTPLPVRLGHISKFLDLIHLEGKPSLDVNFSADGADMNTLRLTLEFTAHRSRTPWGRTGKFYLRAACAHLLDRNDAPMLQIRTALNDVSSQWASAHELDLTLVLSCSPETNWDASFNLGLSRVNGHLGTNWAGVGSLWMGGSAALDFTDFLPRSAEATLRAQDAATGLGRAKELSLAVRGEVMEQPPATDATWAYWKKLAPYEFDWVAGATNVSTPKVELETVQGDGNWSAPKLSVNHLAAQLYHGALNGSAWLDVATRETKIHAQSDFDAHRVSALLTPGTQRWINQYTWAVPPHVNADLSMVLPPWTNRPADWRTNFRAGLSVAGDFAVGPAAFRGVEVSSAHSRFTYTNRVWTVPRLHAERGAGALDMDYCGSDASHEFHFAFDSRVDPRAALPLLLPAQRRYVEELDFQEPPEVHGQVWGIWRKHDTVGFTASLAATNASFRGVAVDSARAVVSYTNRFLRVTRAEIQRDHGTLALGKLTMDFATKKLELTNVTSTLNPDVLRQIMRTNTPAFLKVIHFDRPPSIRASGSVVAGNPLATDIHFDIQGEHFHWTNLTAQRISGAVDWQGRSVRITNIQASVYNTGTLNGWLRFNYRPKHGSSFNSSFEAKDIDLAALVKGLNGKAGHIEGMLDGRLAVGGTQTTNKSTWVGRGRLRMHDALLWDIKLFGTLSPILNAISPGAGYSRASAASATFVITNGGIYSDDLQVQSTGFELLYHGMIGMNKSIDGTVEADLLRNTPIFGQLISTALMPLSKLFEFHISGTLRNPQIEPVFMPKFLMMLLRPFHNFKKTAPDNSSPGPATAPSAPSGTPKSLK